MTYIDSIEQFVTNIQADIQNNPKLDLLYNYCAKAKQDLHRPLRVAITGSIKTGKSTLMNALLGQYIVPTAAEVMTYNVNWFHHTDYSNDGREKIIVHLLDGTTREYQIHDLDSFVGYSTNHKETLNKVHWVDVFLSHPLLEIFDLIDTPGLDSLMGTDSQHTRDLLTTNENRPDAIIYLVYPEFKSKDLHAVEEFHQTTGLISGMNSLAALTRVDMLSGEFHEANDRIADNKRRHANIRYYFWDIYPIAGLPAQASSIIQDEDVRMLKELTGIENVDTFVADHDTFVEKFNWQTRAARERLCTLLSIDGVRHAVRYFQSHPNSDTQSFRSFLYDYSNVGVLKSVIINQFGGRSDFHKCNRVIGGLKKTCAKIIQQKQLGQDTRIVLQTIIRQINQLDYDLHQRYSEFYILADYYNQETYFADDVWDEARFLLGDFGEDDVNRLQLPEDASVELIIKAFDSQLESWRRRASKYQLLGNNRANEVALIIVNIIQTHKSVFEHEKI